jgi:hypothetical protein
MSHEPPASPPPVPPVQVSQRPVWPLPIGVISIVVAVIACLRALGAFATLFMAAGGWMLAAGCFGLAVGLVLLAGGIKLLRRDPQARGLHIGYACLQLLMIGISVGFLSRAWFGGGGPVALPAQFWALFLARVGIGAAYPVFLLIWFFRPSVRAEVDSWPRLEEPPQGPAGRPWPYPPAPEEEQEPPKPLPSSGRNRQRPPTHLG